MLQIDKGFKRVYNKRCCFKNIPLSEESLTSKVFDKTFIANFLASSKLPILYSCLSRETAA